ncbi:hypothetical protein RHMOL_Rhmol06G0083900 [Rhododendron molle]|uniref:Uncharacterized protein n=1 Tax=Rhododendron molle TaxID=49168 RepID=A0ACC0NA89_RHOML|nr:hypothetical protein RHMOL_Rhmol06G0083900 [Rhododendron molle]
MFSGLIPGLNSVNWPDNEVLSPQVAAILTSLLNLPSHKFLSTEAFSGTNATLFAQSLGFSRREWSECRSFVLLIYFCIFIPIVVFAWSSVKEESDGGDEMAAEVTGESPETDDSPGWVRVFRNALFNANGGFVLPESYDPSQSFCGICLEEKQNWRMFRSENCSHSFCYDCTSKHIEARVQDNITVICCPEMGCKAELGFEACRDILSNDVIVRWDECLCMSLIPESHKVYCPFKDCSAMLVNDTGTTIGETECPSCQRLICAKCRVPWHTEFTCQEFEWLGVEGEGREDVFVEELAKKKSWRKCPNCNMYVEKTEGCLHITCRCGYEFCYMCGSKWDKSHMGCRRGQESEISRDLPSPSPSLSRASSSSSIEFNFFINPQSDLIVVPPPRPLDDGEFRRPLSSFLSLNRP